MGNKGVLLLVEDEKDVADNIRDMLTDLSEKILMAENGAAAIEILNKTKVDCVITDIRMPIMNGVEFLKQARKNKHQMPFIVFTGHGAEDLMLEVMQYGAFDFINKPDLRGLEKAVSLALKETKNKMKSDSKEMMSDYKKMVETQSTKKKT
ncbi:MAG: response regulator [Bacteriovoracaceae bacterium]|nr:response regulator [Bacteriovoracaceae bacterium]